MNIAAGEREHRIRLRQTHLIGQQQFMGDGLIVRLHLHGFHLFAPQRGGTTPVQFLTDYREVYLMLYV